MTLKFTIHEDRDGFVLRVMNTDTGSYAGLGVLNGEHEAAIIRDVLQGAAELHATEHAKADLIVGGKRLEELL
jgi:hypothetical protein